MAKKPSITTIASGYYSRNALNTNFENLRDKFDNTLSLDGSTPNAMQADLDMNSNDILNAQTTNTESLRINGVLVAPTSIITAPDATAINYNQGGTGAQNRTLASRLRDHVSVKDFGAVGDGVTDDTTAIQNALNSGAKTVYAPAGTYVVNATLSVPKDVSIMGDGANATTFDCSNTPDGSITDAAHIKTPLATFTALPALGSNVTKNDTTLTFSSAPTLSVGDIIVIYNPTDFSWLGSRSYYRAGEYMRVATVSGSTVEIEGSTCDSYVAANVNVYRVDDMTSCMMKGFTVLAKPASAVAISGIALRTALDSSIEDVRVSNSTYIGIVIEMCFNTQLRHCTATDDFVDQFGGEYGLAISNSHILNVIGGSYTSHRHGITIGGGTGIGRVPNRYLSIVGAHIATTGSSQAADIHGNAEYVTYDSCVMDGGLVIGGDFAKINNNNIRGKQVNGPSAILGGEFYGFNFTITNNTIQNDQIGSNRGSMIDIGGNSSPISSNTKKGGNIIIANNTMHSEANSSANDFIIITNRGYVGSEPASVAIQGNVFGSIYAEDYADIATPVRFAAATRIFSGNPFNVVDMSGNIGSGGFLIYVSGSNYSANQASIKNNSMRGGQQCLINNAKELADFSNNTLNDFQFFSGFANASGFVTDTALMCGNVMKNCGWGATSSSITNTTLYAIRATNVMAQGNFLSGNPQKLRLTAPPSGWTIGETVTGGSSGATATVYGTFGDDLLVKETISGGPFTSGETVTGGTSGATGTVSASVNVNARSYALSFNTITNLYRGNQADVAGASTYTNAISNDVAL